MGSTAWITRTFTACAAIDNIEQVTSRHRGYWRIYHFTWWSVLTKGPAHTCTRCLYSWHKSCVCKRLYYTGTSGTHDTRGTPSVGALMSEHRLVAQYYVRSISQRLPSSYTQIYLSSPFPFLSLLFLFLSFLFFFFSLLLLLFSILTLLLFCPRCIFEIARIISSLSSRYVQNLRNIQDVP